jgi:adenylate cyclase
MAFWNAPELVADHGKFACRAALCCQEALNRLYKSPAWNGQDRFETRFGIHLSVVSVGHFGAPDRFNYTAIGDGINVASRLEGLNKYYGTHIIVSESVHAAAVDDFEFRLLDRVSVKGKTEGLTIYELLGGKVPGRGREPHIERYERAVEAYLSKQFDEALAVLNGETQDRPSLVLAERCRTYLASPPEGWEGVHVFDTK